MKYEDLLDIVKSGEFFSTVFLRNKTKKETVYDTGMNIEEIRKK